MGEGGGESQGSPPPPPSQQFYGWLLINIIYQILVSSVNHNYDRSTHIGMTVSSPSAAPKPDVSCIIKLTLGVHAQW